MDPEYQRNYPAWYERSVIKPINVAPSIPDLAAAMRKKRERAVREMEGLKVRIGKLEQEIAVWDNAIAMTESVQVMPR